MRIWLLLALCVTAEAQERTVITPSVNVGPVKLTPSGFLESIGVTRSAATRDDISTRFGSIPLSSGAGESVASLRNSRIALRGETDVAGMKLEGYVETDFLNRPPQQPYRFR